MHSFCGKVNHHNREPVVSRHTAYVFIRFFFHKRIFGVEMANEWWWLKNLRTADRQTRAQTLHTMYDVPVKGRRRRAALHLSAREHMLEAALQRKLSHR